MDKTHKMPKIKNTEEQIEVAMSVISAIVNQKIAPVPKSEPKREEVSKPVTLKDSIKFREPKSFEAQVKDNFPSFSPQFLKALEDREKIKNAVVETNMEKSPNTDNVLSSGSGKRDEYLSWEDYFMSVAFLSAMRSKDPSTQVLKNLSRGRAILNFKYITRYPQESR